MKTSGFIFKMSAIFLFIGVLFSSCEINSSSEMGTLVIKLPGSSAIGAGFEIDESVKNILNYHIDCEGPGKKAKRYAPAPPLQFHSLLETGKLPYQQLTRSAMYSAKPKKNM